MARTEFTTRLISGVILGAAVLFITWWHPVSFAVMCVFGGVILAREWWGLTRQRSWAFVPLGFFYIAIPLLCLADMRYWGAEYIFQLFALVWAADIGGYLVGKKIGRHKIAPAISPGKSWEGLAGSIIVTSTVAFFALKSVFLDFATTHQFGRPDYVHAIADYIVFSLAMGVLFSVTGLCGDLFESWLKRKAGVKDSGTLIPGHGGLFDRVDALLPCAVLLFIIQFVGMAVAIGGN